MRHLTDYLDTLTQARLNEPQDDLMSAMIYAEEDGERLDLRSVVVTTMTFLVVGFESTNNLFTNLTHALGMHPQLYQEIKNNPGLMPQFVEEGVRWDAVAQGFVRTPSRDVELHGKIIPENAQLLLHIGSANRDGRQFEDSDASTFIAETPVIWVWDRGFTSVSERR